MPSVAFGLAGGDTDQSAEDGSVGIYGGIAIRAVFLLGVSRRRDELVAG